MEAPKKFSWMTVFSLGFVWFGVHLGSGFATGNHVVSFFVRYGWPTVFIPALSVLLLAIVLHNGSQLAIRDDAYHYKKLTDSLYGPLKVVFSPLFEFFYFLILILAVAAVIAGAASLLLQELNIPYVAGIILFSILLLALNIFGTKLIIRVSSVLSLLMIITSVLIIIAGLKEGAVNLPSLMEQKPLPLGWWATLKSALFYVGFMSPGIAMFAPIVKEMQNPKTIAGGFIFGFVINAVILTGMAIMIFCFPDSYGETLPTLYIINLTGISWLKAMYIILLLGCLITTGVPLIYAVVTRFESVWTKGKGVFNEVKIRRASIAMICILFSLFISLAGLSRIVAIGYRYVGLVFTFILIIPAVFYLPVKLVKRKKELVR